MFGSAIKITEKQISEKSNSDNRVTEKQFITEMPVHHFEMIKSEPKHREDDLDLFKNMYS